MENLLPCPQIVFIPSSPLNDPISELRLETFVKLKCLVISACYPAFVPLCLSPGWLSRITRLPSCLNNHPWPRPPFLTSSWQLQGRRAQHLNLRWPNIHTRFPRACGGSFISRRWTVSRTLHSGVKLLQPGRVALTWNTTPSLRLRWFTRNGPSQSSP